MHVRTNRRLSLCSLVRRPACDPTSYMLTPSLWTDSRIEIRRKAFCMIFRMLRRGLADKVSWERHDCKSVTLALPAPKPRDRGIAVRSKPPEAHEHAATRAQSCDCAWLGRLQQTRAWQLSARYAKVVQTPCHCLIARKDLMIRTILPVAPRW